MISAEAPYTPAAAAAAAAVAASRRGHTLMPMRRDLLQARHRDDTAIDVLMRGHVAARDLLARYQMLQSSPNFGPRSRRALVAELCAELAVNLQIEAEIFYPSLREAGLGQTDGLDLAEVEQAWLQELVRRLATLRADAPLFDAHVGLIGEMLDRHLSREVAELYPMARRADVDLRLLGEALRLRRDELLEQVEAGEGLNFENESDDPVGLPPR